MRRSWRPSSIVRCTLRRWTNCPRWAKREPAVEKDPLVGARLKARPLPARVPVRRPLDVTPLDVEGGARAVDGHGKRGLGVVQLARSKALNAASAARRVVSIAASSCASETKVA